MKRVETASAPRPWAWPVVLCVGTLFAGIVGGGLAALWVPVTERQTLNALLASFFRSMAAGQRSPHDGWVFIHSLGSLEHVAFVVWLAGLWPWGPVAVLFSIFGQGFALGFGLGFLFVQNGWEGLAFGMLTTLPSAVFSLPLLTAAGGLSLWRSFGLVAAWRHGYPPRLPGRVYLGAGIALAGALILPAAISAYLLPVLVRSTAGWFGL